MFARSEFLKALGLSFFLFFFALLAKAGGQEAVDPKVLFWGDTQRLQAASVADMVAIQEPFLIAAMYMEVKVFLDDFEGEVVKAPLLDPFWLSRLKDGEVPPNLNDRPFIDKVKTFEWAYRTIYRDALLKSFNTDQAVLQKAAESPASLGQLLKDPNSFRGKILNIRGKLRYLKSWDAPAGLRPPLDKVYEALIETAGPPGKVVTVFSILPKDLEPHVNTVPRKPLPVSFHGYFIVNAADPNVKKAKDAKEGQNKTEEARPLLIGQTIALDPEQESAAEKGMGLTGPLRAALILGGVLLGVILVMIGLRRWYRHGDKKIMDHVNKLRAGRTFDTTEENLFQDHPLEDPALASPERNGTAHREAGSGEIPPGDSAQKETR